MIDPKSEDPKPVRLLRVEVPEGSAKEDIAEILKQEIDRDTDIVDQADYLLIKIQHFQIPVVPPGNV